MHKLTNASTGALRRRGPEISVVVPVYRNAATLRELHDRLSPLLTALRHSYELVFVDDACPEGSLNILKELTQVDAHVAVLELERNMGQQWAVLVGLAHSRGERLVVLDADLQDSPEAIPDLLAKLQEGFAAVFAGRRGRYESPLRLLSSRMFKGLLHLLCGVPSDAGLFVVMTRHMSERLLTLGSPNPHLLAMIGCTRLPTISIPVVRVPRQTGRSGHSSWARFRLALSAVTFVLSCRLRPNRKSSNHQIDEIAIRN